MADLVRVRLNGIEKNVGKSYAAAHDLEALNEPTHGRDGRPRANTRADGRRSKPKTSVAKKAVEKKAAVIEPAPNHEEQNR